MFQHISDNDLAIFSKHSGGKAFNNAYAHARVPAPRPRVRISFFFVWKCAERKVVEVGSPLHYRTTAGPGSRSRPKGSKPGQRAQDPDATHAAWRRVGGKKAEAALAKMATQRECVHVRRVPHMRCVMRATAVHACACVVTLYTLRSVRYQQRLRARARTRPPSPCAHLLNARKGKSSRSAVLHYRTTAGPGSRSRPKGSKPGQRAQDPDPTHLTSTTVRDGEPGASHPQTTPAIRRRPFLWGPPVGSPRGSTPWGPPRGVPPWGPPVGSPFFVSSPAIRRRPPRPSACRRPPDHPHADDLRAIRMQTTSGPSACRRPPGHPHADDLRAIRKQTTLSKQTPLKHFTTKGPPRTWSEAPRTSPANTWQWRSALLQF